MSGMVDPFTGGLIVEGGVVTGAWLRDGYGLAEAEPVPLGMCSLVAVARMGGTPLARRTRTERGLLEPPATVGELAAGVAEDSERRRREGRHEWDATSKAFCLFLAYRAMLCGLASNGSGTRAETAFATRCERRPDSDGLYERAMASLKQALRDIQPFVDTLDPFAVANVGPSIDDDSYAAMDASFNHDAPLAGLVRRLPGLRGLAGSLWRTEALHGEVEETILAETLSWRLSDDKGPIPPERVSDIRALAFRFEAMPDRDKRMARSRCKADDPARLLAGAIMALPRPWEPRTGPEWVAMARCLPTVRFAMASAATPDITTLIGGKGRWTRHFGSVSV